MLNDQTYLNDTQTDTNDLSWYDEVNIDEDNGNLLLCENELNEKAIKKQNINTILK